MPISLQFKKLACVALVSAGFGIAPAFADNFADISKLSDDTITANTTCMVALATKLGRPPNDAEMNGFTADCMTQQAMVAKPDQAADGSISVAATLGSTTKEGAIDSGFTLTMVCKDKTSYVFLQSDAKFVSKEPKLQAWYASAPDTKYVWDADEDSFYLIGDDAVTMLKSIRDNSSDTLVLETTDDTTKEHHYVLKTVGDAVKAVSTACEWK